MATIHGLTVSVEADTDVRVVRDDEPSCERIAIGGDLYIPDFTLWPGYLSSSDADVITACDHLIEALQEVRAHSLQRLAAAELAADPGLLFAGTVGDFLAVQEAGEAAS